MELSRPAILPKRALYMIMSFIACNAGVDVNDRDLRIMLDVEEPEASPEVQRELLLRSLRGNRLVSESPVTEFQNAADRLGLPLSEVAYGAVPVGDFMVPLAQVAIPALGGVLVGWLQGRAGRKVRIKTGDTEAEARTPDDVARLLDLIAAHKAKMAAGENETP